MPTKSHQLPPKRILVIGAGVIGAIYGWALSQAGHQVTHLVRPGKAAALADGLLVDMFDVRQKPHNRTVTHYPLRAIESLANAGPFDLVIVPTKHYQLEEALRQVVPFTSTADYFLLTQNWNGTAAIDAILPPTRYIFGDAKAGGTFKGQTLVATLATLDVGQVNSAPNACLARIVDLFESAGLETTVHDQMLPYLWTQYAMTGGMWFALVQAGSFEAVLKDRQIRNMGFDAARECLDIVAHRGVDLSQDAQARMFLRSSYLTHRLADFMLVWMFRHNEFTKRSSAHALASPEEIRVFYDDLYETGKALGVQMPTMRLLKPAIDAFCPSEPEKVTPPPAEALTYQLV